jgi:MoxR-like ATPase
MDNCSPNSHRPPTSIAESFRQMQLDLSSHVIGKERELEQLLIALIQGGHCLLEGVAGTAKSTLADCLGRSMGLRSRQMTLASDMAPVEFYELWSDETEESDPPNLLLLDGIEQCSAKVRGAIVDATQSGLFRGPRGLRPIATPFLLLATHPPYQPGPPPYAAPSGPSTPTSGHAANEATSGPFEARFADQFMFQIPFRYPGYGEEFLAFRSPRRSQSEPRGERAASTGLDSTRPSIDLTEVRRQLASDDPPVPLVHYVLRLVRATRVYEGEDHDFILEYVSQGAGPRGVASLLGAARARAVLYGRDHANVDDVRALAHCTLRHRLSLNAHAIRNGITVDQLIDRLLEETPERAVGDTEAPSPPAK